MQRNKHLAGNILQLIETLDNDGTGLVRSEIYGLVKNIFNAPDSGDLVTVVDYHLHLLETEGLAYCEQDHGDGGLLADRYMLTWSGHDFIESGKF